MKMRNGILFVALMVAGASVQAMDFDFNPYVGVDAGMRHMKFSKGFGGKQFEKNYAQGNLFVGAKFNPCVGLELGYTKSNKRKKTAALTAGDAILGGAALDAGEIDVSKTETQISGVNVSVVGFYPINDDIELLGAIGIARQRLKLSVQPIANELGNLTAAQQAANLRTFSHSKYILQARVGAEYKFTSNFGVRAMLGWENTGRFKKMTAKQSSPVNPRASAENSVTGSLGVVWHF